ncbi:MAG: S9 family peptidase [Verrucomicrobia bacterium]|nr:S9 family peptidase [Verrucomicrobiota bacterium]
MFWRLLLACAVGSTFAAEPLRYPVTRKDDVIDDYHGTKVPDPYRWLEDADCSEVKTWIEDQNELTFAYLGRLPARDRFNARLTRLLDFERFSAPVHEGDRYFFLRNTGLQNQSVLLTTTSLQEEPRPLLDPNTLSADGTVALTEIAPSRDGRLLAYMLSTSGSDWAEMRVREVETGRDRPDALHGLKFTEASWTNDHRGFFYARFPAPEPGKGEMPVRNQKFYYHRLGDPQEKDRLILDAPEHPDWLFEASTTEDGRYLIVQIQHGADNYNLLYVKDLGDPLNPDLDRPFQPVIDQFTAEYRPLGVVDQRLLLLTNQDAPRSKIVSVALGTPTPSPADATGTTGVTGVMTDLVPEMGDRLERALLAGGKLVLVYLVDAKHQLRIAGLDGKPEGDIPLPSLGTIRELAGKPGRTELFYSFTSFLYPTTVYRYDLATGKNEVFHRPGIDFDPGRFETRQIFYHSKDGTRVPMFIVHSKGIKLDGSNPVYLTGYGGFNISRTPEFSTVLLAWVEKGGIFAQPNLRGGGEYGQAWHLAGTRDRKQNVFDDFYAAAETLIAEGYTNPAKLAIIGGSNGGLLVGAAVVQRPELFGAAVAQVGVMDMLRYQKFTIGWAWEPDYGVSDDPGGFTYLFRYSPLHNIKPGACYPSTLITTADHDDRVVPAHSFKFAAALQAAQGCANPVLIRVETRAGHGGGRPLTKFIDEQSDVLAFMWERVTGSE